LSTCVRCVALKPAVVDGGAAAGSGSRARWKSGLNPAASPEPPPCAAVGFLQEGAPSLGGGAGGGGGMGSAPAVGGRPAMPRAAATNSPRPMPAMVPSPASPPVGSRPVWREDDEFWQKALNHDHGLLNNARRLLRRPGSRAYRRGWPGPRRLPSPCAP